MKLLISLLLFTGCSTFQKAPKPRPTINERIERCVFARINDGVKPIESFEICDSIYRRK